MSANTLLSTCLSHDSSGSSSNGSSTAFSFTDSAYASSSSPPSQQPFSNNTTSQSISIMRGFQSQQQSPLPQHPQQQQQGKHMSNQSSGHTSVLTGLPTSTPSSSLSSVHSATTDHPGSTSASFFHKQQQQQQQDHYNYWNCSMCQEPYKQNRPQVLQCFHTLCETCVEKVSDTDEGNLCCPLCGQSTMLNEILPDFTVQNHHMSNDYMLTLADNANQGCTACKSTESTAVAKCFQCSGFLCHQCVCAHRIMNCFEGHRVSLSQ